MFQLILVEKKEAYLEANKCLSHMRFGSWFVAKEAQNNVVMPQSLIVLTVLVTE